jgi:hypothetical protein
VDDNHSILSFNTVEVRDGYVRHRWKIHLFCDYRCTCVCTCACEHVGVCAYNYSWYQNKDCASPLKCSGVRFQSGGWFP